MPLVFHAFHALMILLDLIVTPQNAIDATRVNANQELNAKIVSNVSARNVMQDVETASHV